MLTIVKLRGGWTVCEGFSGTGENTSVHTDFEGLMSELRNLLWTEDCPADSMPERNADRPRPGEDL
jgi:hypothetical protein